MEITQEKIDAIRSILKEGECVARGFLNEASGEEGEVLENEQQ